MSFEKRREIPVPSVIAFSFRIRIVTCAVILAVNEWKYNTIQSMIIEFLIISLWINLCPRSFYFFFNLF